MSDSLIKISNERMFISKEEAPHHYLH